MFGDIGSKYLKAMGIKHLTFYPIGAETVDSQDGTLLTQLWFGRHAGFYGSDLNGDIRNLGHGNRVRGVRRERAQTTQ